MKTNNSPMKKKEQYSKVQQRKDIEETLKQLHRLQSEIYDLNVPDNLHGSPPVRKQIKQLTYLYQNMIKPKKLNSLNVSMKDIQSALKIINDGIKGTNKSKIKRQQQSEKVSVATLKQIMKDLYHYEFDMSLVSRQTKGKNISAEQIYNFINYNQYDEFDPYQEAFHLFLDEKNHFSFKRYNQMNQIFGLPHIKNQNTFKNIIGVDEIGNFTVKDFKHVLNFVKKNNSDQLI